MAPPSSNGCKWCFQSQNRLSYNFLRDFKSQRTSNCITGSRVTAILLNGWIFPIGQSGEASWWRVCYQRGLPRLVFKASALWADAFYKSKCPSVRLSVRLSVCLFTFEVPFNGLFAPTFRSRMCNIFRDSESLGKSN